MEQVFETLKVIDWKLVLLIVVASYWYKKQFSDTFTKKMRLKYQILIFSTILTTIYYVILRTSGVIIKENWVNYFITYGVATSFYDLAFKPIEEYITKKFGNKKDQ